MSTSESFAAPKVDDEAVWTVALPSTGSSEAMVTVQRGGRDGKALTRGLISDSVSSWSELLGTLEL